VVPVLQNGALKWKKNLTGVRSRAVTSDHELKLKLCEEKNPTEIQNALHEVFWDSVVVFHLRVIFKMGFIHLRYLMSLKFYSSI